MALLTVCVSLAATAQTNYPVSGAEYSVGSSLPGDQVHPQAAINSAGGFVVCEDNTADPYGMGIKAAALDPNLTLVGAPFRVNKNGAGDQERPSVALLNGGGSVFVWQGGRPGFQHIYARFLSSSNTWLTSDVQVNTFSRNSQIQPSVTVLTNGNVLIVWSSFNQAGPGSLRDIYGQIFSPIGEKIGTEIPINQVTLFNQRNPAVAALPSGGFLVAWISEQQRTAPNDGNPNQPISVTNVYMVPRPSVDVYVRVYDSDGASLRGEILANTGSDPCANPSVAAGSNGGFVVAWAQRDMLNRSNSWDIFVRAFSPIGTSGDFIAGASRAVNTELFGDQYSPSIVSVGGDFLAAWTSLGQDGSREGVYGQFLGTDGSSIGPEFRVNTTTLRQQMHPALAADSSGRFLALWTSYVGNGRSFDVHGQRYVSLGYVAAPPPGGPIASSYAAPPRESFNDIPFTIVADSGAPKLDSPGSASVPSVDGMRFTKGSYSGLFSDVTNGVGVSSSGGFNLSVDATGHFTGMVRLGAQNWPISGQFDSTGKAYARAARTKSLTPLDLELQMDVSKGQVSGLITDGRWLADLYARRNLASSTAKSRPAFGGYYTFDILGSGSSPLLPGGDGYGTLSVDANGVAAWTVVLPDGQKATRSVSISDNGLCALYAPLYNGNGALLSWLEFSTNGFSGESLWVRPAGAGTNYYPSGFTNQIQMVGAKYRKPAAGQRALDWSGGRGIIYFSGADIDVPVSVPITVDGRNLLVHSADPNVKLSLNPGLGVFSGAFVDPASRKTTRFQGALYRDRRIGRGYFLGAGGSGQVSLEPAQ
jgi:hypothetical protein